MADRSASTVVLATALGDEPLAPLVLARHVGARRVICVGRPVVAWRVEPLLDILRREGRTADWLPLDAEDIPDGLDELNERLPRRGGQMMVFDLTNAHGLVGFALYELARRREQEGPARTRLVRIDWSDHLVRSLSPDHASVSWLGVSVRLAEFLELHGKRLLGVERAPGRPGIYGGAPARIARNLSAARPILDAVHHGRHDAPLKIRRADGTTKLVHELIDDGVLRTERRGVLPTDMRAFQFLHGRWLEEYVFEVGAASGRFADCASGVRFSWSTDGVEHGDVANEIDFVGMTDGRATVASCKTGFRDAAAPLYELLTLAERAAGRSVVTVFATSETLDRAARYRAAALGIRVLDAGQLSDTEAVMAALLGEPRESRAAGRDPLGDVAPSPVAPSPGRSSDSGPAAERAERRRSLRVRLGAERVRS